MRKSRASRIHEPQPAVPGKVKGLQCEVWGVTLPQQRQIMNSGGEVEVSKCERSVRPSFSSRSLYFRRWVEHHSGHLLRETPRLGDPLILFSSLLCQLMAPSK